MYQTSIIYRAENDGDFEGYAGGQRDNGIDAGSDVFGDDDVDREQYHGNSEDEQGDDLLENIEADYEARPELDVYENRGIDD